MKKETALPSTSEWFVIMTEEDIKSWFDLLATADAEYAKERKIYFESLSLGELYYLAHQSWINKHATNFQLARSYAAIKEAKIVKEEKKMKMPKLAYKLVRDRIPYLLEKEGYTVTCKQLRFTSTYDKKVEILLEKFQEEIEEFSKEKTLEELADIYEVLHTLCEISGYDVDDLFSVAQKKREEKGGFANLTFCLLKVKE